MAHALVVHFDDDADAAVRSLWQRLEQAGIPAAGGRPHLTYAAAGVIPPKSRAALREDLSRLWLPDLWLHTLSAFATSENVLVLGAVVDNELLAVHSTVHDVLAGKVKNPSAYHLPGNWVPHCTLAHGLTDEQVIAGFAALHPVAPIRAKVRDMSVVDTQTGEIDPLRKASTAPR